jgi:hypothetical protein
VNGKKIAFESSGNLLKVDSSLELPPFRKGTRAAAEIELVFVAPAPNASGFSLGCMLGIRGQQ